MSPTYTADPPLGKLASGAFAPLLHAGPSPPWLTETYDRPVRTPPHHRAGIGSRTAMTSAAKTRRNDYSAHAPRLSPRISHVATKNIAPLRLN